MNNRNSYLVLFILIIGLVGTPIYTLLAKYLIAKGFDPVVFVDKGLSNVIPIIGIVFCIITIVFSLKFMKRKDSYK